MDHVEACERSIAAAVHSIDGMRHALERIVALHGPAPQNPAICHECVRAWPCETAETAQDAL